MPLPSSPAPLPTGLRLTRDELPHHHSVWILDCRVGHIKKGGSVSWYWKRPLDIGWSGQSHNLCNQDMAVRALLEADGRLAKA